MQFKRSFFVVSRGHLTVILAKFLQAFTSLPVLNPLAHNDVYISRTAQLISRRCILNIYSTNILTEYFEHAAQSPFFFLQDAVYFIMLSFLVPVIFTNLNVLKF